MKYLLYPSNPTDVTFGPKLPSEVLGANGRIETEPPVRDPGRTNRSPNNHSRDRPSWNAPEGYVHGL